MDNILEPLKSIRTFDATNNATELVFKTGVSEDASTGAADGHQKLFLHMRQ